MRLLFIGGRFDGQRQIVPEPLLQTYVARHAPVSFAEPEVGTATPEIETEHYQLHHLNTHNGGVTLYAKAGMTTDDVLVNLIAGYNRPSEQTYQQRVLSWMLKCFGLAIAQDATERNHRFLEEALELVQTCGCTRSEALQLVDYVFDRPAGEKVQEVGGVLVTLAALCFANNVQMTQAGETELARVWENIPVIRAKQAAKPKHSSLPQ
jgi:hypothetical protein